MSTDKINGNSYAGDGSDILDEVLYRGVIEQAILAGEYGEEFNSLDDGYDLVIDGVNGRYLAGSGSGGNSILLGGDGRDWISGFWQNDVLYGGAGHDYLLGGRGEDVLFGGEGRGYLHGGRHDDILFGGAGRDHLNGDGAISIFHYDNYAFGNDLLFGGEGRDSIRGEGGDDILVAGEGMDRLYGDNGNDVIYAGTDFGDYIIGGAGIDTLSYANSATGISVQIPGDIKSYSYAYKYNEVEEKTYGYADHKDGEADRIEEIENIVGSDYADAISGNSVANVIHSRAGSDVINAGGGDDTVFGGDDDDTIRGEDGNDYLNGENGNDVIEGGEGGDAIVGSDGDDTLRGGDGHNYIYGNDGDDVIDGGDWSDVIGGGAGDNVLQGAAGNDRYVVDKSDRGSDTISDRRGNNELLFVDSADGAGYSEGSFSFSRSGDDLTIEADSGNRVVIEDYADSTFSIYYDDASQVQHELVVTAGLF